MALFRRVFLVISICLLVLLYADSAYANDSFYGKFHELYSDQAEGTHHLLYTLEFDNGTQMPLQFINTAPQNILSGTQVVVFGKMSLDENQSPIIIADQMYPMFHSSAGGLAETFSSTTVVKKAVIFRVNFSDAAVECSKTAISDHMWNGAKNINSYFEQNSFGYVTFPSDTNNDDQPDIYDVTIPASKNDTCTTSDALNWANLANNAAISQGLNLSLYQYKIYVLPGSISCGWAGLGYVGCGNNCTSWSKQCNLVDVIPHEIGHNFKFKHSSLDTNQNLIFNDGSDCEYCDTSGIMGYGGIGWRHFHASHKASMGWLPEENILTVNSSGNFTILAGEVSPDAIDPVPSTNLQILRLNLQIPNGQGTESALFDVSFRSQYGDYSSNLPAQYRSKITIHRLINYPFQPRTLQVATLSSGQTFEIAQGVNVTFNSFDQLEADVSVSFPVAATPTSSPTRTTVSVATTAVATPTSTPSPTGTTVSIPATATSTPASTTPPIQSLTPVSTSTPTFQSPVTQPSVFPTPEISPTQPPAPTKYVPPYEAPKSKPSKALEDYVPISGVIKIKFPKVKKSRLIVSAISSSGEIFSVRADKKNIYKMNLLPGAYTLQYDIVSLSGESLFSKTKKLRVKTLKNYQKVKQNR